MGKIVRMLARNKWRYMRGVGYSGSALSIFNTVMLIRLSFGLNLGLFYIVLVGIGIALAIVLVTWLIGYLDVKSKMVAYEQEYVTGELNPFFMEMNKKLDLLLEELNAKHKP